MEYIGEHLWAGQMGNIFVIISFTAALLAALSYFSAAQSEWLSDSFTSWKKIARISFRVHSMAVLGIVVTLFIMLFNHYFEYQYVWQHSNKEMDMQYIASCFWEGQEGSFLLWVFWHVVIGNILIRNLRPSLSGEGEPVLSGTGGGRWEAPVMATVSLVQVFLCSMLLGIYLWDYKVGSNPFTVLLREHPDFKDLPFVQNPNYLEKLDGKGLNPLLQNYWMVIHPPTLFLGFAATLVPFSFAIAGLWKKKFNEWQKPALPWTFFGIMVLGTGILMGGAWAYEALSFGGFWAWDPVENASLVPWITFVGAGHVMMIHKNKGQSLLATFFLALITFILILYSTFLTRSGILGDTSVHAFTDLGMSGQLLVYLFFFILLPICLFAINFKNFPREKQEDSIWSREFWMLIGALVLAIAAFQISLTTSIPVINKVFGTNMAPPGEGKIFEHYHQWQIPFAVLILLLMAITQFFKYKKTDPKEIRKNILIPLIAAFILAILIGFFFKWFSEWRTLFYALLLFASLFAIFSNITYFIKVLKGRFAHAGPSIAHVGFGMILLGALISTSKSENISINRKGDVEVFGKDFSNKDCILLQRYDTVQMGDYYVSYRETRKEGVNVFYDVEYMQKDSNGIYSESFALSPRVQVNPKMGNVAEPDTRHFLTKDIYTHIKYADLEVSNPHNVSSGGYKEPHNNTVALGDTFFTSNSIVVFEKLITQIDKEKFGIPKADIVVGAALKIFDVYGKIRQAMPIYYLTDSMPNVIETTVDELGLKFAFWQINPETEKIDIAVSEKTSDKKDFIVMQAIVFPYINILWMGCILMIIGTVMAIRRRIRN
ncbi:MAG: cytochrome C biogenesis protein [Bacteroidetes bacterium]|nr:MAG: cytochrome C biogenesis protein [Bacteroidota bacterium]